MNLASILTILTEEIKKVAAFIRQEYERFDPAAVEFKGHNNLVSYVDKQAEEMLEAVCKKLTPHAGFINEETGYKVDAGHEYVWIIDPLDGTTNFVQKIPVFAISVALQYRGEIILGVVHEINRDETFYAIRGEGAYLNGKQIFVTNENLIGDVVVATGFPYSNFYDLDSYLEMFRTFLYTCRGLRRLGSAAVDLAYTAAGRFGGFFEANLSPWDVAAGSLIVQEAGGIVTDYFSQNNFIFGKSIIASNPTIHPQMMEIISKCVRV